MDKRKRGKFASAILNRGKQAWRNEMGMAVDNHLGWSRSE
jgi:hypothetical protein